MVLTVPKGLFTVLKGCLQFIYCAPRLCLQIKDLFTVPMVMFTVLKFMFTMHLQYPEATYSNQGYKKLNFSLIKSYIIPVCM